MLRFAATVALLLVAAALGATAASAADLPRLSVERGDDAAIVDDGGREVLLRGINVQQLGDYFQADPAQKTTFPLTEEDFAGIAKLGFNVVRLTFNWSAFQPQRDAFDEGYVARIRQAVRWAAQHDLYVVLDMHQDAWGKFIATKPGETCPPGFGPAVGWDGAPEWATLTDGLSTCRANNTRELSPAVAQAFQSFYADRDGIQTQLVQTWGRIAKALGGESNVAGYDLLNEPHPGFLVGPDQSAALGRFYGRAIDAIRANEQGGERIVFFEPSVVWSGFGTDALPPPGFTSDRHIVFAPHLYAESITTVDLVNIEQGFQAGERAAALYDAPLWSGEWGWFGKPEDDRPKLQRYAVQEDRAAIGGAWWVWRQACGDPHVVGYPGASGSLNRYDCPGDRPLGLNTQFTSILSRAYPRHAPGRITSLRSDADAGTFEVRGRAGDGRSCALEVWVPGAAEPALSGENLSDLESRAVPGGHLVGGCARGTYALRGQPGEARPGAGSGTPSAKPRRCRSRRVIRVTLRRRARSVRVRVDGAKPTRVRVRGKKVRIDLRGRPRQRVVVRIRSGREEIRRVYRTCRPSRRP